jgi:ribosomal protein S12 methylthiotransferase
VLKAMRRPANQEKVLDRLAAWRNVCPDLAVRSTFIVGFPGETEADFAYLLDWLKAARLERVGCFKYEPVAGAASEALGLPAVPEAVKQERWERFMAAQQEISAAILAGRVGREIDVIVDDIDPDNGEIIARSQWDAPEIDGNVFLPLKPGISPGDIVRVRVTEAEEYDLLADITDL